MVRTALDNANAATKANSMFLARMSHDMRTPMNGTISVESNISQGTKFTVVLDYPVIDEKVIEHKQEDCDRKIEDIVARLKNKRILLVEDHPLNTQIAKKFWKKQRLKWKLPPTDRSAFICLQTHHFIITI